MKQTIILPRRKLYEQLLILEDFILEIERFILYDKEHNNIHEYTSNDEFEPLLHDTILELINLTNIFYTTKLCNSTDEFTTLLATEHKRNKHRRIEDFLNNIKHINTTQNYIEDITQLLEFISKHNRWGKNKELTKQFFTLIDTFHTIILRIIEQPSE